VTEGKTGQRLKILAGLVVFLFATLTTRLWFLQVLASESLRQEADENRIRLIPEPARRGRILDRSGNVLVGNRLSLVVMVNRQRVEAQDAADQVLFELQQVLETDIDVLLDRYNDTRFYSFTPIPIAVDVPKEAAFQIAEYPDRFPGVEVVEVPVREYPYGEMAVHLLGHTGEISEEELAEPEFSPPAYGPGDRLGKSGVERSYESALRGEDGVRKFQINSSGRLLDEIGSTEPVPGDDVVLSIDAEIQSLAEESLGLGIQAARSNGFRAPAGAVVVMDPNTGQLLAMTSLPSYDPTIFLGRVTEQDLRELNSRNDPQLNRAMQAVYAPASTFKPFIALSALKRRVDIGGNVVDTERIYPCPATWTSPTDEDSVFGNWRPVDSGFLSMARALAESCDTVFYPIGHNFWERYRDFGREPLQDDLRLFGFDQPTLVDLPYEASGRIPDSDWKRDFVADPDDPNYIWYPGDVINMSIGQGDALVTPLQMAVAYSAIANGGTVYVPHLALRVQEPGGDVLRRIEPQVAGRLRGFTQRQLGYIRDALQGVVQGGGTAALAFSGFPLSQIPLAAKTGTTESNVVGRQSDSWFAAMAPADDPQYVVVAIVEQAGHGSSTAAPVVRRILEGLFGLETSDVRFGEATD
jgi:penicillin-binding protein 2